MSHKESIAKSFGQPVQSEGFAGEVITRDQAYEEDYTEGGEFFVDVLTVLENEDDDELTRAGYQVQGMISGFCYWMFATEEEAQERAQLMNLEIGKKRLGF